MNAADRLLSLLDGVRPNGTGKWVARCPAHEDRNPSLSVAEGAGKVLVRCWAGCSIEEIVAALGIHLGDLFDDAPKRKPKDPDAELQRKAAEGLERWRQKRLDDDIDVIRGLELLADGVHKCFLEHGADLGDSGTLPSEKHAELVETLRLCYHSLPEIEHEFELLNSKNPSDHLTAWRATRMRHHVAA